MRYQWVRNGEEDRKLANFLVDNAMTRRGFTKFLGFSAAATAGAGMFGNVATPTVANAAAQTGRGGVFRPHLLFDPGTLDPVAAGGIDVFSRIIEPLAQLNLNNEIEGILAESWDISKDETEYTFHLRQGISYHDGTPFNADAVKWFFDRIIDPKVLVPFRSWVGPLKETVVVDEYTAKLVLSEPFSPLLGNIAIGWYALPSPASYEKYGADVGQHPVGTGPFIFKEWIPNETVTLLPNPNYKNNPRSWVINKGVPLVDSVEYHVIPDASTAQVAFESGEVDEIRDINRRDFRRLQNDPNYKGFIQSGGTNVLYIEFAMFELPAGQQYGALFKPPFDDLRVRQAVGYGIDIDTIMAATMYGLAERNYGPMPTALWAYKPEIEQFGFHYNPDKAKALLDEAGWVDTGGKGVREKDGKPLHVLFYATQWDDRDTVAQVVQNHLNKIGFDVAIQMPEGGAYNDGLSKNENDFNFSSFSVGEPDVLRLITNYDHGLGRYKDEQFQTLVAQAQRTIDRAARTNYYFEASKRMLADAAMIPFWTPLEWTTVRAAVKNYHCQMTYNHGVYEDVYIEE
jgi:peptide/nickel transport system substrate-binding protein